MTLINLPEGAVVLTSSKTTHNLPDGSTRIDEVAEILNKDGTTSTVSTSTTTQAAGAGGFDLTTSPPTPTPVQQPATTSSNVALLPPSNPNAIGVLLNCNQDYNAVIEYYGSRAGTIETANVAYVKTSPSDLPFPVFHESDRVLAFVKANIEAYASRAYMYTTQAWNLRESCSKTVACKSRMIAAGSMTTFMGGLVIFAFGLINSVSCDSRSRSSRYRRSSDEEEESCSSAGAVFGGIVAAIGFVVMMLDATTSACLGHSGPTGKGTAKQIYSELNKTFPSKGEINKYSLELAQISLE